MYDVLVIGGGPGGLSSAIYSVRYGLKTAVLFSDMGMISSAPKVENYPGFESVSGVELIMKFQAQARKLGAELLNKSVTEINKSGKTFKVSCSDKSSYESKSIIISTGAKHLELNVPGEKEFAGKGVSYCAICDAALYRGLDVCVVGWSWSASVAANILSNFAKNVYVLAKPSKAEFADLPKNVKVLTNTEVKEIKGSKFVEKVILKDGKELKCDGIFVEIGFKPSTELAERLGVEISKSMIKVSDAMATNVEGVFAAGDITTGSNQVRQVLTAAAEGCVAANSAYTYLTGKVSKMQLSSKQ